MNAPNVLAESLERLHDVLLSRSMLLTDEFDPQSSSQDANRHAHPISGHLLDDLGTRFGLSNFERDLLFLTAAMELDGRFPALCAGAQVDQSHAYPTFALALSIFEGADWNAFSPTGPLRYWSLITIGPAQTIVHAPLRIDERILQSILGNRSLDVRLLDVTEELGATMLVESQRRLAYDLASIWAGTPPPTPIIQLCGEQIAAKRGVAAAICEALDLTYVVISASALPSNVAELDAMLRLWQREVALGCGAMLLACDDLPAGDSQQPSLLPRFINRLSTIVPLMISTRERRRIELRPALAFDVAKPTMGEQRALWRESLESFGPKLHDVIESMVFQFDTTPLAIRVASTSAMAPLQQEDAANDEHAVGDIADRLWDGCRVQARPRLDDLAQRIDAVAGWDDLILPDQQLELLHDIADQVALRPTVYDRWGFSAASSRGLGISAIFAGSSGTGKTMSAEVLARHLKLDLYRIDLSGIVNKYIGETEKNLRRVFDAAEEGGVILLFDEADALFGKRSEVKDSHDRFANIEVSYLLQRMEAYRGLAILTTNFKDALDTAFLRRVRFLVHYPFPDLAQRALIWQRVFPAKAHLGALDFDRLARLNVAGGNIRNIALNAAFLAAAQGTSIHMEHVLGAARSEYLKLQKTLTDAEIKGWV